MNTIQQPVSIFVVENDNLFVKMLDYIFSSDIVFKFHDFKSEEECLKNLDIDPSVIILDHALSGIMNGSDTIRAIKKEHPQTHIIILLDRGNENLASKLLNAGANDYLFKEPNLAEALIEKLESHLRAKNVKRPFFIKNVKPSLKMLGYFFLILFILSLGVYYYK